jgi:hypothetical protein
MNGPEEPARRVVVYELVLLEDGRFAVDLPTESQGEGRVRVMTGSLEDCCAWIVLHERGLT